MTATLWSLRTTSDPVRLVPGSPAAVRADAIETSTRAATLRGAGDAITAGTRTSTWTGLAHDAWLTRRHELRSAHDSVAEVLDAAATAMRAHADVLAWGQARAALAANLWSGSVGAATCTVPTGSPALVGSGSATASPTQLQAESLLDEARADVAASAEALALVLDRLGDGLPDGSFHAGDFFAGIGSWVAGIAGLLWQAHLLHVLVDPRGWFSDVQDTWDANADAYALLTQDPLNAPAVLLDTQALKDRPGRWWGQLAPDLALTVVGGAGAGLRASSGLRAVESRVLVTEATEVVAPASLAPEVMTSSAERIREALLALPKGDRSWVRLAESSEHLEELDGTFSEGGSPTVMTGHRGTSVVLPDGTTVALRDMSRSGGPTIDVTYVLGAQRRVHVRDF